MKSTFPLNFIWPEMLWLLVAVPLLVLAYLWLLGRRKKTAVRYANLALVKQAAQFPREVEAAARAREPHRIAFYLYDLAAAFHAFWNLGNDNPALRVIVAQDAGLSAARLYLVSQIGQVIRNGLGILGVEAVEEL